MNSDHKSRSIKQIKLDQPRQHQSLADDEGGETGIECPDTFKQAMLILELPPEVIALILIRLPVTTLSILKCVNKYFSRFISCPKFIRDQLEYSTNDASMSGYKIIFEGNCNDVNCIEGNCDTELKQASVTSFCHESPVDFDVIDYPEQGLHNMYWIVGSCNGLVLLIVNREHLFLWNPTIRKHEILPSVARHESLKGIGKCPRVYFGFGYDASNDDYKVLALFDLKCKDSKSRTSATYVVNVYSSKKNTWTRIPDFTGEKFDEPFAKLACGKLYWASLQGNIVSFDVEREVFETPEPPSYGEDLCFVNSSVLGGSFSLCCDYSKHVDVWVMKENGNNLSWTKMFTVSDYEDFISPRPYFILPNGEVLSNYGVLDIYNPKDNSWRPTEIFFNNDPVTYVESLVSPRCN